MTVHTTQLLDALNTVHTNLPTLSDNTLAVMKMHLLQLNRAITTEQNLRVMAEDANAPLVA